MLSNAVWFKQARHSDLILNITDCFKNYRHYWTLTSFLRWALNSCAVWAQKLTSFICYVLNIVDVYVGLYLLNLNELNEVQETMKTTGFLFIFWEDEQLDWTPSSYGGITYSFWPQVSLLLNCTPSFASYFVIYKF